MAVTARRRPASPLRRLLRHDLSLGTRYVAGADEAGRGALAGPLVAAAVLLEPGALSVGQRRALARLDDSKRCTQLVREALLPAVLDAALAIGVVVVGVPDVDGQNIHRANLRALATALRQLDAPADCELLSDGFRLPLERTHRNIIDGDETSAAIAAASIVAKVTRDRLMVRLAATYPAYGFERHVGYGTPEHLLALRLHGPTALHRRSFAPCSQLAFAL
jgi:ribonuclease HII